VCMCEGERVKREREREKDGETYRLVYVSLVLKKWIFCRSLA
jgi:hypothetical protein